MLASRTTRILVIGIGVILICALGFFVWKSLHPEVIKITPAAEQNPIPYYVFDESYNGTTTSVVVGGTVIVQLAGDAYSEPVEVKDAAENILHPKIENYNGAFVISFSVPTTTALTLSAHNTQNQKDFSLIFIATSTEK